MERIIIIFLTFCEADVSHSVVIAKLDNNNLPHIYSYEILLRFHNYYVICIVRVMNIQPEKINFEIVEFFCYIMLSFVSYM